MSSRIFATKDILYLKSLQLVIKWDISEQGCTTFCILASRMQENGENMRKLRGNGERFTLYISSFSLYFLPLYPFPISKNCYILSQNVKYGTFVAKVTKNSSYVL